MGRMDQDGHFNVTYAFYFNVESTLSKEYIALRWADIKFTHRSFIDRLFPFRLEPNPLPLLMRAVNCLRLGVGCIFQPRWKAGRFKAKT